MRIVKWFMGIIFMLGLTGCTGHLAGVLDPRGLIAYQERKLFFDTLALMLIVVLPVIIMSFTFAYHYRASHLLDEDNYKPNWGHNYFLESLWWGIPCVIIFVLAVMTWQKTHELNPSSTIAGQTQPPLIVQVIALPWKWLFIYPQQHIATINYLEMPVGQQVEFWLTTDNTPMSSFFIPQLGSQLYAMAGMRTRLHLIANEAGEYQGLNAQFSGDGFSDMHFTVHAVTADAMQAWVASVQKSPNHLTDDIYRQLLNPSMAVPPAFYAGVDDNFFNNVINLYMHTFGPNHPRDSQMKISTN